LVERRTEAGVAEGIELWDAPIKKDPYRRWLFWETHGGRGSREVQLGI